MDRDTRFLQVPMSLENTAGYLTVSYSNELNNEIWNDSLIESAKAELSEEAALKGGEWIPLLPLDHPGIPEVRSFVVSNDKYCWYDSWSGVSTDLPSFWCWIPRRILSRDNWMLKVICIERLSLTKLLECIEIRRNVSMQDIDRLILHGQLMMPSVQATHMALHHLAKMNLLK